MLFSDLSIDLLSNCVFIDETCEIVRNSLLLKYYTEYYKCHHIFFNSLDGLNHLCDFMAPKIPEYDFQSQVDLIEICGTNKRQLCSTLFHKTFHTFVVYTHKINKIPVISSALCVVAIQNEH